jgi:plastocyanin
MTLKRIRLTAGIAVLAAMVLALGACGSDDDDGGGGGGSGAQQEESSGGGSGGGSGGSGGGGGGGSTVQVTATDFEFDPADPKVEAGKVKFEMTNNGQAPHAIEIEGPSGEAETETVQAGEKTSVTVDLSKPGKYTMYCPVGNHRQMGMEGEVTVGGGSAAADDGEEKASGGGQGVSGY